MSRRRRNGSADAVTDLVAKLPWWVGVVLAPVREDNQQSVSLAEEYTIKETGCNLCLDSNLDQSKQQRSKSASKDEIARIGHAGQFIVPRLDLNYGRNTVHF